MIESDELGVALSCHHFVKCGQSLRRQGRCYDLSTALLRLFFLSFEFDGEHPYKLLHFTCHVLVVVVFLVLVMVKSWPFRARPFLV